MNEEILFQITRDVLDTGCRGVPVGYCSTSEVRPMEGLYYRGYPINDLAEKDPEAVIYLLYWGELPNASELDKFKRDLAAHVDLDPAVLDHFHSLSKKGTPLKWMISGLNAIGMIDGKKDYRRDFLKVIAQLPTMIAALLRIHAGWGPPIPPRPDLGYMENFVHMLNPPNPSKHLIRVMRIFNILHYDHGGGNLSTFIGKAIASGHADIYESLAGSMAALNGPLHGGANRECLLFLKEAISNIEDPSDEEEVQNYIASLFQAGKKIYGFGHAVLRTEDPRATIQYEMGKEIAMENKYFRLALTLRKVATAFLSRQKKMSNPYPNIDAVSGALLNATGLKDENHYTTLFGMSRCVGIGAQIVHERTKSREGKGTPIFRPKYIYNGPVR